jgi:hypothetical protein
MTCTCMAATKLIERGLTCRWQGSSGPCGESQEWWCSEPGSGSSGSRRPCARWSGTGL